MTILEAIRSKVPYPMSEGFFQSILIERSLSDMDEYTKEIALSASFKGAMADALIGVATAPSISEGDIRISKENADILIKSANSLYSEIGEEPKGIPTVTFIE